MKKQMVKLLGIFMAATLLAGCGAKSEPKKEEPAKTESQTETKEGEAEASGAAKTGLAVITGIDKSKDAAEEDGLAEVDSLVAAVIVDEQGKIVDCKLDAIQTKINFSKEGKITSDLKAAVQTKQELGEAYGMKKASKIQKEWNEQADAFAAYVKGKTADEVKGIAVSEEGTAADADLASSVTVHIGDFISVVDKAVANAKELGAAADDKLGLAISTDAAKDSKDASASEEGLAEAYTFYSAVTKNAEGKLTSCVIDASQGKVSFDATGKITADLKAPVQTKQELGEAYGMKKASKIQKEWNEQADAFAAYVTGKTADEVKGIAVSDQGTAADADLASSVTVHIAPFMAIVDKAAANAK